MNLVSDLKIGSGVLSSEQLANRLQVSSGSIEASLLAPPERGRYRDWAIVPRRPWRRPNSVELDLLTHGGEAGTADIAILNVSPSLLRGWRHAAGDLHSFNCDKDLVAALNQRVGGRLEELTNWASEYGDVVKKPLLRVNAPGMLTTTTDDEDVCIGMHVDNWHDYPLATRDDAPNRICVNMSDQPRYLLWLNVRMSAIPAFLCNDETKVRPEWKGTPIGLAFLQSFPRYPILSLRIEPGEAYLAPTENLVHDGSTEGTISWDVAIHVLGRFAAPPEVSWRGEQR